MPKIPLNTTLRIVKDHFLFPPEIRSRLHVLEESERNRGGVTTPSQPNSEVIDGEKSLRHFRRKFH